MSGHCFDVDEIRAVSCGYDVVVWKMREEILEEEIDPHGVLVYSGVVLVADGTKRRILVLDLKTGSCIQKIDQPDMGWIYRLFYYQGQLVVLHGDQNHPKISYFNIK